MAHTEIHYLVLHPDQNTETVDLLVDAFEGYRSEQNVGTPDTIVMDYNDASVFFRIGSEVTNRTSYAEVQDDVDVRHEEIQTHFPVESRAVLQKRFAGIAISGELGLE